MAIKFRRAKHCDWIIPIAQLGNAFDLAWHNRLHLYSPDLKILQTIPKGSGLILAANHSDEMDIRVCMELSRRSKRRFTYMVNSEAFEECRGFAGWWLQHLGCFSVERGGQDREAIRYAVDLVKNGHEDLVIFPEGEIYYVNDLVQPFKTGAVHIGLQALSEVRETHSNWNAHVVPVAIKYRYRKTIESILSKKINKMEKRLLMHSRYLTLQEKLILIMAKLLKWQDLADTTLTNPERLEKLKKQVDETRASIMSRIESTYKQIPSDPKAHLIARAQKMIFFLREQLKQKKLFSRETQKQFKEDLKDIKETIQMAGWQPQYIDLHPSEERLAETVMKLEREVFQKKRARPLGDRDVFMRIGKPIDLGAYFDAYGKDPSFVAHQIAEELHHNVQLLIEKMTL